MAVAVSPCYELQTQTHSSMVDTMKCNIKNEYKWRDKGCERRSDCYQMYLKKGPLTIPEGEIKQMALVVNK